MKPRNLTILVLVAAAVAAFIYFVERHQPTTGEALEQAERIFPELDTEAVTEVQVSGPEGVVNLAKEDDEWRITAPLDFPADGNAVDSLLQTMSSLTAVRRLTEEEVSPADYGLDSPERSLVMTIDDGTELRMDVGNETSLGSNRAVSIGTPGVILCSGAFARDLDKELDQWRSRDVVSLYPADVASLEVRVGETRIHAVHLEDTWRLLEPLEDLADPEHLRNVISNLDSLEVVDFLDDADPSELGLDAPEYHVTVLRSEGREPLRLDFGQSRDVDGVTEVVCRRNDRDLFWIKDHVRTRLAKAAVRWRSKVVYPFETWDVERVVFTHGEFSETVERRDGLWRMVDGSDAEPTAVQERLTALSKIEAEGFDLMAPVTSETGRVEMRFSADGDAEGEVLVFTFFAPFTEGGRSVVTVNQRDTVMSLDSAQIDEVLGSLEALRVPVAAEPLEGVEAVEQAG